MYRSAQVLAAFVVVGHFAMRIKSYLAPMLGEEFDLIPKTVMQSVFRYVSVFLVLAAAALILAGAGVLLGEETELLVQFIGICLLMFALVQVFYAFKSKVKNPLFKLFQWTLFLPIGILCIL